MTSGPVLANSRVGEKLETKGRKRLQQSGKAGVKLFDRFAFMLVRFPQFDCKHLTLEGRKALLFQQKQKDSDYEKLKKKIIKKNTSRVPKLLQLQKPLQLR